MKAVLALMIFMVVVISMVVRAEDTANTPDAKVEASLMIEAPLEQVWDQSLDVRSWPEWIDIVKSSSFKGQALTLGSTFKITLKVKGIPLPFKLTVCEYHEHQRIAWRTGGAGRGLTIARSLIYEDKGGKTLVTSREEFTGPMTKYMFRMISEDEFTSIHEEWLKDIKDRVEGTR